MKEKTLRDSMEEYEDALKAHGLTCTTRLNTVQRATTIILRHEDQGKTQLDGGIVADYLNEISERLYNGAITENYADHVRRATERFVKFIQTGEVKLESLLKGSQIKLLPKFQNIVDKFLDSENFHPNTRNDMRWVAHKYFEWLSGQGCKNLNGVGAGQIQKFMLDCSTKMAMGSVHNIRLYLAKLYAYLYKTGQSESSYQALFSFKVNRDTKVQAVLEPNEIVAMLGSINRKTVDGKRAYAAMMLGAALGIRACDVVNLKLSDIDWVNGEIKILQAKTAVTVVLPLTKDVGEALKDYILTARPVSNFPQVFLKLKSSHEPLKSAATIGDIYNNCRVAAGLCKNKKFHTLRRSLGTAILASGSPVTMVAQLLGQSDIESTKKYIATDFEHLKMCALTFEGITPVAAIVVGGMI